MPQVLLEYSKNLPPALDDATILERLHALVAYAGDLPRANIKSRILCHERYAVGDGDRARGFAHLTIALLGGKPPEVRARVGRNALAFLESLFPSPPDAPPPSLTVEVREMEAPFYFKAQPRPPETE